MLGQGCLRAFLLESNLSPLEVALKVEPAVAIGSAHSWETEFYTPPVLGGAALFDFSAPAVYKIQGP